MPTLTPNQLISLASETINKRVKEKKDGFVVLVDVNKSADASLDRRITVADYEARIVQAAAIMYAESGGKTDAFRPESQNPRGGNDRGLWQWNSKAWPTISDMVAFDPNASTEIAYKVSNSFSSWGPWTGSKGLDKNSTPFKTVAAAYYDAAGGAVDDTPVLSQIDPDANGVPDVIENATGWLEPLTTFLKQLVSGEFWWRIGMGAIGVLLIIGTVVYLGRSTIIPTLPKG